MSEILTLTPDDLSACPKGLSAEVTGSTLRLQVAADKSVPPVQLNGLAAERIEIVSEANSQFTWIQPNLENVEIHWHAASNSKLTAVTIQDGDNTQPTQQHWVTWQDQHSHFEHINLSLSETDVDLKMDIALEAEEASCRCLGAYLLTANAKAAFNILTDHQASHTQSQVFYKGILDNKAQGNFATRAVAEPGVSQISAQQKNPNLLLSRQAKMQTKPELEIYADAVQCSHGATVGQLDNNALFYLRSRGIDAIQAQQLLTQAFLNDVLSQVDDSGLSVWLNNALSAKLTQHFTGA